MGVLSLNYTIKVNDDIELTSLSIGPGTLEGLSLFVTHDPLGSSNMWVEIGILSGGDDQAQRAVVLAKGYAGSANSVFWNGALTIGDNEHAYARVLGVALDRFRLVARIFPTQKQRPTG